MTKTLEVRINVVESFVFGGMIYKDRWQVWSTGGGSVIVIYLLFGICDL